ncbi:MAG: hypothetical protein IKD94_03270 [Erysipelotrichaceae bacterium]|nr:hypothetical protein [Erysipelotrichaceae bacterium]
MNDELKENRERVFLGYEGIDRFTNGLKKEDLILIKGMARGTGEMFADNIVANVCRTNRKVLLICESMRKSEILERLFQLDRYSSYRDCLIIEDFFKTRIDDLYRIAEKNKSSDLIIVRGFRSISSNFFEGINNSIISRLKLFAINVEKPVIISFNEKDFIRYGYDQASKIGFGYELKIDDDFSFKLSEYLEKQREFELMIEDNYSFKIEKIKMQYFRETRTVYEKGSIEMKLVENAKLLGLEAKDAVEYANLWRSRAEQVLFETKADEFVLGDWEQ